MVSLSLYCAVFLLANVPFCCYGGEEEIPLIPIGHHNIAGMFGEDIELLCEAPFDKYVDWLLPSGVQVSKNVSSDRLTQLDTDLRIKNVTWNDTGIYMCRLNDSSRNETVQFKVYEMPTYFIEGIIILSINCGLLLLFLVCVSLTFIKNKKKVKAEKYRRSELTKALKSYS